MNNLCGLNFQILYTVGIRELVICAITDVVQMWQDGFGFKPLAKSMRRAMKPMGLVMFPGKPMLQKHIPPTKNKNLLALISRYFMIPCSYVNYYRIPIAGPVLEHFFS